MTLRPDLEALARRLPPRPLTRFAPSPTGALHLGHVVNAIYVWGLARALGGRVLLRIEDHDRERSRPEYERAILDDLDWLGLVPDIAGTAAYRAGPCAYRQSDHPASYDAALGVLAAQGRVFGCDCTRRRLEDTVAPVEGERPYDGRCRARGLPPGPGVGARIVIDPGEEAFDDGLLGPQRQDPSRQCGDLLARDRLCQWTYQFAVTVDDREQAIDLVIRGEDLLASTGRQIRLARLLGRETLPVFVHHPLLYGSPGVKLSKANRDTSLEELRRAGVGPDEVLGRAAAMAGLAPADRPIVPSALAALVAGRARD